jgi:NADH-quinone oxidoreductase subunit G
VPAAWGSFGREGPLDPAPFRSPIENYYMTDPISRASETMAKCTEIYVLGSEQRTGTHG